VSVKIPYRKYPAPAAPGGFFYVASIPVSLSLPARNTLRSKRLDAIVASGVSMSLFHGSIGRAIGMEVEKGEKIRCRQPIPATSLKSVYY
jgi:hypothetical protein